MSKYRDSLASETATFTEDTVKAPPIPGLLVHHQAIPVDMLDGGEIVILALKPSMWFLFLVSIRWLLTAAVVILLAPWLVRVYPAVSDVLLTQSALLLTTARLIVALLQWSARLYVLTNRRVLCIRGVLQVRWFEAPLVQIRNTYVRASATDKMLKIGSIGFSLKDSEGVDSWWEQIAEPEETHEKIRRAIGKALDHHPPL